MSQNLNLVIGGAALFIAGMVPGYLISRFSTVVLSDEEIADTIADTANRALHAISGIALVIDEDNVVISATESVFPLSITKKGKLRQPKLEELVNKARRTKKQTRIRSKSLTLKNGLGASEIELAAQAVHLGAGYVLLIMKDETDLLSLERTRRDFVANISHELKTPIGAISLLAEAIQSAIDDPIQVKKFANSLELESARLIELVQDIIQLSKVQSADVLHHAQVIDLNEVINIAVAKTEVLAGKKDIEIKLNVEDKIKINGNQELIVTLLKNLIENAVIYSDEGRSVKVIAGIDEEVAEIVIKDKGPGIPQEELDRIFERFYRIDPSRSRNTGGTGLGLSIAKHIVQKHLGELTVESEVGVGSTFTIRIPSDLPLNESNGG